MLQGVENRELWGSSVKWGIDFKFNTSRECCKACKAMCHAGDGPCLCDSWVFCGDKDKCKEKFGQCWLKKQEDPMFPDLAESGEKVPWTSGVIFGKGEGIIGIETEIGTIRVKLFPECAPHSMVYIAEVLKSRHCVGCHFYRAEPRGLSWDESGDPIRMELPAEACPALRRGSVAWIGAGPEFFISLANHGEWRRSFAVFGSVLSDDLPIAERIARLPAKPDAWNDVPVRVLEAPLKFKVKRSPLKAAAGGGGLS
ncbi:unnamed protein product [Spirodela intermedia]|uniref:PPIase cyclophilin-type domain-containing protein n=1 Tax=Spirodela intermedia TaxID=51605 RepID=A0A7I8IH23_SPIIN|nr:unnamed protein product [Spirodela intermedia]CAA6657170.1 unnamed protein product [Spirodela intermedia]CAA6675738.1 unnamed protein product [Spirodela intermedia]